MRLPHRAAAAPATTFSRPAALAALALALAPLVAAPAAVAGEPGAQQVDVVAHRPATDCRDLQPRLDAVMGRLSQRVGEAAAIDVTLRVSSGRVVGVEARGGPAAYHRGLRRALRGMACGERDGQPSDRALRVLVVDAWNHLPAAPASAGTPL